MFYNVNWMHVKIAFGKQNLLTKLSNSTTEFIFDLCARIKLGTRPVATNLVDAQQKPSRWKVVLH